MLVSLFVHVTDEPTEILIGFGVNPLPAMEALTLVGLGDVGELFLPHAIAADNTHTANVSLQKDMISSFQNRHEVQTSGLQMTRDVVWIDGENVTAGLRRTTCQHGGRKPSVFAPTTCYGSRLERFAAAAPAIPWA